jgi:hypothetical protein
MKLPTIGSMLLVLIAITAGTSYSQGPGMMGGSGSGVGPGMVNSGTGWGAGAFRSNGERIYYTSTSSRGEAITYSGGPTSTDWMITIGQVACVSCHGPSGRGDKHTMGMGMAMDSPDIRWSVLKQKFDTNKFRLAVVKGQDPDGTKLKQDMPRWKMSDDDLADLIAFLKTLP